MNRDTLKLTPRQIKHRLDGWYQAFGLSKTATIAKKNTLLRSQFPAHAGTMTLDISSKEELKTREDFLLAYVLTDVEKKFGDFGEDWKGNNR